LLAQAGGLQISLSDVRAVLKRNGHEIAVDLLHGDNPPIEKNDMLILNTARSVHMMVAGNVTRPGLVDLKENEGPLEAIALAGGLQVGTDPVDVKISIQQGAAKQTILYTELATHAPIPLNTGDVLSVDTLRDIHVVVSGEVAHPGMYTLKPGEGLMEALAMAGGPLPDATLAEVKITRAATGATEVVDFSPSFRGGKESLHVALSPGDQVVVPVFTRAVAVLGFVQIPGYYPLIEGRHLTVADAIGLAKGVDVNHRGALKKVALMRTETTGASTRLIVDLEQYFKTGDTKYNPEVKAGDLVYVPQTTKPDWMFIFQALSTAATVGIAATDIYLR
jgi:protein involved in polysaccharide export with SLBB domain